MDPDSNLNEQLSLAMSIIRARDFDDAMRERYILHRSTVDENDCVRLAELVLELDKWIQRRGFIPSRWNQRPQPCTAINAKRHVALD